jgi:predicted transposase/invertase (TIGR01784 family)
VIAVHQLPEVPETLWLRLLGRDNVQKRAISELMTLPSDHPYRQLSLRHIAVLQKNLQARQNLSKDLREVAMNLAITYEQIEAELIQKGIEQGIEQGKVQRSRKIALELLREGMSPEKVARLTELPIDQLPRLEN